jgi:AGZA family xanthine/uracil permease-like MFS transporter
MTFSLSDTFDTIGTFIGTGRRTGIFSKEDENALDNTEVRPVRPPAPIPAADSTYVVVFDVPKIAPIEVAIASANNAIAIVPAQATAPALILVGVMMLASFADINWLDLEEAVPAFFACLRMRLTS